MGRPIRKCPGVSTSTPSSLQWEMTSNGLLLRQASICERTVVSSLKFNWEFPTIWWRWLLTLLTTDSHSPLKCGACSGMKSHWIPWLLQTLAMAWVVWFSFKNSCNSLIIRLTPTKFVPWLLHSKVGFPLLEKNLLKQARKASEVRSYTAPMCTALVDKDTNMHTQAFTITGLRVEPCFWSSVVQANVAADYTRCDSLFGQLSHELWVWVSSAHHTITRNRPDCLVTTAMW